MIPGTIFASVSSISSFILVRSQSRFRDPTTHADATLDLLSTAAVRERVQALSHRPADDLKRMEKGETQTSTIIKRKVRFPGNSPSRVPFDISPPISRQPTEHDLCE
jgi:hypothetical protein